MRGRISKAQLLQNYTWALCHFSTKGCQDFSHQSVGAEVQCMRHIAKKHGVKVGAHPSFPDLQGFGRREMKMPRQDIKNMIMYQVGALKSFLDEQGMPLNHIKPHGSLYVMAAKDENMAHAIADAVETFNVSIFGMANTCHEKVYKDERGLNFVSEFYADLDYDENGKLVIAKGKNATYDSKIATDRVLRAISEKKVKNNVDKDIDVGCDTICVHSDTPNAVEIIKGIKLALNK